MKYLKWFYSMFSVNKLVEVITATLLIVFGIALINEVEPLTLVDIIGIFLINAGYMFIDRGAK